MSKFINVTSHSLTQDQRNDAINEFGVTEFVEMPDNIKKLWGNVPPDLDDSGLDDHLQPLIAWLDDYLVEPDGSLSGNVFMIQGDYGATFKVVNIVRGLESIPVYATTQRSTEEVKQPDGSIQVKRTFKHVRFRKYNWEGR